MNYILDENGQPVIAHNVMEWGKWLETADRQVAKDTVGDCDVSTVFLGVDCSFGSGPPVLWETMIFGGAYEGWQDRYTSREAAIAGHAKVVEALRNNGKLPDGTDFE